ARRVGAVRGSLVWAEAVASPTARSLVVQHKNTESTRHKLRPLAKPKTGRSRARVRASSAHQRRPKVVWRTSLNSDSWKAEERLSAETLAAWNQRLSRPAPKRVSQAPTRARGHRRLKSSAAGVSASPVAR